MEEAELRRGRLLGGGAVTLNREGATELRRDRHVHGWLNGVLCGYQLSIPLCSCLQLNSGGGRERNFGSGETKEHAARFVTVQSKWAAELRQHGVGRRWRGVGEGGDQCARINDRVRASLLACGNEKGFGSKK